MALPELAVDAVSIVVRGAYNPAIFSPSWLLSNQLIGTTEYEASQVEVISPTLTVIQADWLRLQATGDSFMVSSADPREFERTRDAALGILQTLKAIPISVMGINREMHFQAKTSAQWHTIGDMLAPKSFWGGIKFPGLLDLTIIGSRLDSHAGRVQAQVQPSVRIKPLGVYVAYNDHYELRVADSDPQSRDDLSTFDAIQKVVEPKPEKVQFAIAVLTDEWEGSMERAAAIVESVSALAKESQ